MEQGPTKSDIEEVFHRLRATAGNKSCFDCNAKNPTWSSVTYGVFICIDCSAVHRSLGVHLTFVRSTQLDTNWTWVQLRQMQLGGNTNALQFFTQHNCVTTDAQKKYNSRAAQLYRDKLHNLALASLRSNNQLHIQPHVEEQSEEKEDDDFFADSENFSVNDVQEPRPVPKIESSQSLQQASVDPNEGPNVDFTPSETTDTRKSTIATRKTPAKKLGLGSKKGGLGATKVKTNFAELEKEAELAEENRQRLLEETAKAAALTAKEQEERKAAVRLAYKDLSIEQSKREEQLRKKDPKKAEQIERLGMGVSSRTGISHSALSDMQEIEQENLQQSSSTLSSLGKLRMTDNDSFFDDYSFSSGLNMNRNSATTSKLDSFYGEKEREKDSWVMVDESEEKLQPSKPEKSARAPYKAQTQEKISRNQPSAETGDAAQKKFGNAKAISSDQYFDNGQMDYETKANLNRFQGSSSISSAEFFGNGRDAASSQNVLQAYDLDDVKESVRQGVTKVAGKISSLANGMMSSFQDRYGY